MKKIALVAVLLVVLGALSFIAPIPRRENHEVQIGDTKIGIQTENTEKLPPSGRYRSCRWGRSRPGYRLRKT